MYEEEFSVRLTQLRLQKGVSARDMSLSIGQNAGYIHSIESGKSLPSMSAFFFICDFLKITPKEFFDTEVQDPNLSQKLYESIEKLNNGQKKAVETIVNEFLKNK